MLHFSEAINSDMLIKAFQSRLRTNASIFNYIYILIDSVRVKTNLVRVLFIPEFFKNTF